jgi:hypothetical protein
MRLLGVRGVGCVGKFIAKALERIFLPTAAAAGPFADFSKSVPSFGAGISIAHCPLA